MECPNCGSSENAKAKVQFNLTSTSTDDMDFIIVNKPTIVVCRKCGNISWELEGV